MATPEKISTLANMIKQIHEATYGNPGALPDHEWGTVHHQLFEVLQTLQRRLVMYLAYTDDMLVGAEYCDECGEVTDKVVRIEREPDLMIITDKRGLYPQDVDYGCYFRLPGSDAYGERALAELARARVGA